MSDVDQDRILKLVEGMSGVGHWRYDVIGGSVAWSDQVYAIHGVRRETYDPNLNDNIAFYHAEDRATVVAALERAVSDQADYAFQLRLVLADGDLRHVICRATCEINQSGATTAVVGVFQDITETVDTLAAVKASEAEHRLLTENATDIIARYGFDGIFRYVSPAIRSVLGYEPEEIVGRQTFDMMHPDDRAFVREQFRRCATLGEVDREVRVEYRARHKDGCFVWLEAHPKALFDAKGRVIEFHDVARDITSRRDIEEKLQASEARYRLLADNANDMIIQSNAEGKITFTSPGCQQTIGYKVEELMGRNLLELAHPEDVGRIVARYSGLISKRAEGVGELTQFRGRHKDGRWVWLEGRPTIFFDPQTGRYDTIQDVVRDITERKALEIELEGARIAAEAATSAALHEIKERKLLEQQLREAAETDPLTGLPNRRAFLRHLKAAIAERDRGRPASLAMIDLDFFKRVNDQHGHGVGDTALTLLGDLCRDFVRTNDVVARIGGEEFALVLNGADLAEAHGVSDRLRVKIADCRVPIREAHFISLSASIGVAAIPPGATCDQIMATADGALYRAKSNGRNQVVASD